MAKEYKLSLTAEQIDETLQKTQNLPIQVTEDGYTDISGLRQMTKASNVFENNTLTITQTLEGGVEVVDTIQLDDNGMPSSGISDGVPWTMNWEGFEAAPSLPPCTESDNDKFLRVVSGVPTWTAIPNAEEATF